MEKRKILRRDCNFLVFHDLDSAYEYKKSVEVKNCVDFVKCTSRKNCGIGVQLEQWYVCGRNGTYCEKLKFDKRKRQLKKQSKKIGYCLARIIIAKKASHVEVYVYEQHTHPLGIENAKFTRNRNELREKIRRRFQEGVSFQTVWEIPKMSEGPRDECISVKDVRAIQHSVDKIKYALHNDDILSTATWIQRLITAGAVVYYESTCNDFHLGIVTDLGRHWMREYQSVVCLDSTHKTNKYNYLYTWMVRNEFGQGFPASFYITSSEKASGLRPWIEQIKQIAPNVQCIITDNDDAEINVISEWFPNTRHYLCWWHILKNWRKHLHAKVPREFHATLWPKLKHLLKESFDFEKDYQEVISLSTPEFANYLMTYYYKCKEKWARQFRSYDCMNKKANTTVLVESWHNLLKSKFMQKSTTEEWIV